MNEHDMDRFNEILDQIDGRNDRRAGLNFAAGMGVGFLLACFAFIVAFKCGGIV